MTAQSYQLIIIGAGSAGLTVADEALRLGVTRVALIEKDSEVGGTCANVGCVPTKTLLKAAKLMKSITQETAEYGIQVQKPGLDFSVLSHKVYQNVVQGDTPILKDPRVTFIQGEARFTGNREVTVVSASSERVLEGEKIIIATGAGPRIPAIPGLADSGYMTYQQASRLTQLPKSLLILGAGPIGVEFAQAFQNLGVQVTLVNQSEILSKEDPAVSQRLRHCLEKDGIRVEINAEAIQLKKTATEKILTVRQKLDNASNDSVEKEFSAEEILVSLGIVPMIEQLNLAAAGIKFTERGITVSDTLCTSNPAVWAVGDVSSPFKFTHVADYEAVLATQNAFTNEQKNVDYHAVPWAIYTMPAVAHVGLTESQAKEKFKTVVTLEAETEEVSRYRIETQLSGFIKLIMDADRQVLVGANILAEEAEEMAHLLLLAIQEEMPLARVRDLIYIYPAKAQLIQKALEKTI